MDAPTKFEKWVPIISLILFAVGSTAYAAWSVVVVDVSTSLQNRTSLENQRLTLIEVDNQPAISYQFFDDNVRYSRFDGTEWDIQDIDDGFSVLSSTSMKIVDGVPAVAFTQYISNQTSFNYAWLNNDTWQVEVIEPTYNEASAPFVSLAVVNGTPAVVYNKNESLLYAVRTETGWQVQTVAEDVQELQGNVDYLGVSFLGVWDVTLVEYNSSPMILYNASPDGMKLATLGESGWQFEVIPSASEQAYNATLAIIDGQPAVIYHDDFVYYAHYNEQTMQWQHTPIAEIIQDGTFANRLMALSRLTTFNGQPAFAFSVVEDRKYSIKVAFFDGSEWFTRTIVTSDFIIFDVELADIDGVPM
ncbi:MAG: hypothetical protein AAF653_19700, partial [Chloroflexota bacterium]